MAVLPPRARRSSRALASRRDRSRSLTSPVRDIGPEDSGIVAVRHAATMWRAGPPLSDPDRGGGLDVGAARGRTDDGGGAPGLAQRRARGGGGTGGGGGGRGATGGAGRGGAKPRSSRSVRARQPNRRRSTRCPVSCATRRPSSGSI